MPNTDSRVHQDPVSMLRGNYRIEVTAVFAKLSLCLFVYDVEFWRCAWGKAGRTSTDFL